MAVLAGLKKLVIPGGTFQDPDLYLNTDELKWFGSTVIAKVFRRSRPLREVFYLAWTTDKIAKKYGPDESDEQTVFVSMARSAGCTLHSIPNGGFRDMETATKMKREGMSPGAPDLVVITGNPVDPMNGVPIVAIEFKKANGTLGDFAPLQLKWMEQYHTATGGRSDACGAFGYDAGLAMLEMRGYAVPPRGQDKYTKRAG